MTAARTWDSASRSWTPPPPPRRCLTCGVELPKRQSRGAPQRYCAEHAPVRRTSAALYYAEHRDELLEYQRRRNGSSPRRDRVCACGKAFRGYVESCSACRRRARRRKAATDE